MIESRNSKEERYEDQGNYCKYCNTSKRKTFYSDNLKISLEL